MLSIGLICRISTTFGLEGLIDALGEEEETLLCSKKKIHCETWNLYNNESLNGERFLQRFTIEQINVGT